jgi:acyl-CoA synthetase (AMP-forming)/AMP-acid ligase II
MIHTMQAHDSLVDLARARANDAPAGRAYAFLPEGPGEESHLTHRELDERSRAIAAGLQRHAGTGDRALLLLPPGREFVTGFFGALYAGLTVVPIQPPAATRLEDAITRLTQLAQDAQPAVVIGPQATFDLIAPRVPKETALGRAVWRSIDELSAGASGGWRDPRTGPDALAFLQYTSGSTGAPRGVMVRHGNVLANCAVIQAAFETDQRSQGVIWLPPYHDMGLIGGLLHPLFVGFPVALMTPTTFLLRPLKWLQAISRRRATVSGGPNFAYDWCARKIAPEKRAGLDLSCWRVAFVGAEPVRAETLARFTQAFAPQGFRYEAFYPCYGLAEATLMVSGGRVDEAPIVRPSRRTLPTRSPRSLPSVRSWATGRHVRVRKWPSSIPNHARASLRARKVRSGSVVPAWPPAIGGDPTRPSECSRADWRTHRINHGCGRVTWGAWTAMENCSSSAG